MLGYVMPEGRGAADRLMRETAEALRAAGVAVAGAVQINTETSHHDKCRMDLHVLPSRTVVPISQSLGPMAEGCRLDPDGLERAVGLVAAALEAGAGALVVNKFGKQEAEGRGFRPVIGEAIAAGVPVVTAVAPGYLDAFLAFAGDLAERLPEDVTAVCTWCRAQAAE
ncbi:MAG: DUF2478 domain-containing protein [Roseivivax sp.]|nr:DUF2478 domain-containing protein [Roseivivax sp.]